MIEMYYKTVHNIETFNILVINNSNKSNKGC